LLDLKLLSEFGSGNTIRLYEIFKSYAFKKKFDIGFNELRKQLGFFNEGNYQEWKYFNAKVLKPAVKDINSYKQFDIEVFYEKKRYENKVLCSYHF
jgi:plasmid replication initiation protein